MEIDITINDHWVTVYKLRCGLEKIKINLSMPSGPEFLEITFDEYSDQNTHLYKHTE